MNTALHYFAFSVSLAVTFFLTSCNVNYDMVMFQAAGTKPTAKTPIPKIGIDTNVSARIMGGNMKSKKPYDIHASYTDTTITIASVEFTKVLVTYADGSVDPGIAALRLPKRFDHTYMEEPQFLTEGTMVINKSRSIHAEFPRTISRDEPFTLQIEGHFTKDNGAIIPFKIKEKFNISRDTGTQTWVDFVSGC